MLNMRAVGHFTCAALCGWAAVLWAKGGLTILRKDEEREIWSKAEADIPRDPHSTTDGQAELANEVKAPAQGFGFNGVSER